MSVSPHAFTLPYGTREPPRMQCTVYSVQCTAVEEVHCLTTDRKCTRMTPGVSRSCGRSIRVLLGASTAYSVP
eukprot:5151357-Pyramimonas_sp.AAC.1